MSACSGQRSLTIVEKSVKKLLTFRKVIGSMANYGGVSNVMFLKIGLTTLVRVQNPHKGYLKFSQALY